MFIITQGFLSPFLMTSGYIPAEDNDYTIHIIYDNLPPQWSTPDGALQSLVLAGEQSFYTAQDIIQQVSNSRFVQYATGKNLDAVLALVGIARFINETDDQYRTRALAIINNAYNSANPSFMSATLSEALGYTVQVLDDPTTKGNFIVLLLAQDPSITLQQLDSLIDSIRAAGTGYVAYTSITSYAISKPLVGTFKVGTKKLGSFTLSRVTL